MKYLVVIGGLSALIMAGVVAFGISKGPDRGAAVADGSRVGTTLTRAAVIDLPGPPGRRFDYLTIDYDDHYLFSAHLGAGLLYVIDLRTNTIVKTITGGILSARLAPFTFHVNVGGGVDRSDARPFANWGLIGELPVTARFRFVSEVNGESTKGQRPNNSVLVGFIWQPSSANLFLDAGVRRGISSGAPDWEFTAGVTFGFKLAPFPRHGPGS
jgi:hypothetical protein